MNKHARTLHDYNDVRRSLGQGSKNRVRLLARATKFYTVSPNIFSIITAAPS